jgi:hypothetical protein
MSHAINEPCAVFAQWESILDTSTIPIEAQIELKFKAKMVEVSAEGGGIISTAGQYLHCKTLNTCSN